MLQFTEVTIAKELITIIKKKKKPDLVLLEVTLNDADGIETCWDIRANEAVQNTVVFIPR